MIIIMSPTDCINNKLWILQIVDEKVFLVNLIYNLNSHSRAPSSTGSSTPVV